MLDVIDQSYEDFFNNETNFNDQRSRNKWKLPLNFNISLILYFGNHDFVQLYKIGLKVTNIGERERNRTPVRKFKLY